MTVRKTSLRVHSALLISALLPAAIHAQDSAQVAQSRKVPVRELGPVEARTERPLNGANMLRGLPDGGFFVNDVQRKQVLRFDASLKNATVVADTAGAPLPYGQRQYGLLSYLGDSTILVDPSTMAMVVLNHDGKVARVMAPPRVNDIGTLASANLGSHAFDNRGRLIYRGGGGGPGGGNFGAQRGGLGGAGGPGAQGGGGAGGQQGRGGAGGAGQQGRGGAGGGQQQGGQPFGGPGGRGFNPQAQPDSVPIVRADFDTRKTDTVTWIKVPRTDFQMSQTPDGGMRMTARLNPLPQGDDWTLLADGTVAVVRVLDFHVDYYAPDGQHMASPKLPFDWKQITDEDKVKLIDSLKIITKDMTDRLQAQMGGGGGGRGDNRTQIEPVEASKLPDYFPPIRAGTTLADYEGNLWVLPATSSLAAQLASQMQNGGIPGVPGGGRGFPGGGGDGGRGAGRGGDQRQQGARGDSARTRPDSAQRGGARPDSAAMAAQAMLAAQTQYVYDVINRKGELVSRVQLPKGRQLIGFGPNGAVFLLVREGRQAHIERARITGL